MPEKIIEAVDFEHRPSIFVTDPDFRIGNEITKIEKRDGVFIAYVGDQVAIEADAVGYRIRYKVNFDPGAIPF